MDVIARLADPFNQFLIPQSLQVRKLYCLGMELEARGSACFRKQTLIVRWRKGRGRRFIHDELVLTEAPQKQSQLTTYDGKLKLWLWKSRGRLCGRQVGLEENYIWGFATAQLSFS